MSHRLRQAATGQKLEGRGMDAMLVSHLPNIRYLTGFTGSNALLLLRPDRATLFTDGRYREQAAREVKSAAVVVPPRGDLWKTAAGRLRRTKCVALENDHVTLAQRDRFRQSFAGRLGDASGWIAQQRRVKDPDEIAALRRAVQLASGVFSGTVRQWRPGMSETEAAGRLEFALRRAGGEGLAFDSIVVGGDRGALVHGRPSSAPLPGRGFVVCDYGVQLGGYMSDMTRTPHMGRPDAKSRAIYKVVLEAQLAAIAAIHAGARASAIDRAARRVIAGAGYGEYFSHSTGHGVGLEIHEAPRLGARSTEELAQGEVITVEPGIYVPGWGGVRIEDMVLVTERGAEVLTPTPKELLIL